MFCIYFLSQSLKESYEERLLTKVMDDLSMMECASEEQKAAMQEKREWNSSWITQFSVLWTRGLKERRHELLSPLRFYQVIALSFVVGMLWFKSSKDTYQDLTDQVKKIIFFVAITSSLCTHLCFQIGLVFFISLFWGFFTVFTAIFTFPQVCQHMDSCITVSN